jgi:hypothetical protein
MGEEIYQKKRNEWETLYPGKIVAIDVQDGEIAGIGIDLDEVYEKAVKKRPKSVFYFRKVGTCPAPTYLWSFP